MEGELYRQVVQEAECLVNKVMGPWDFSHDACHAFRVRALALSLASEERLPTPALQVVELAALLHDIDDHKYVSRVDEEHETAEQFLVRCNVPAPIIHSIISITHNMGFKEEISGLSNSNQQTLEFKVVQDADRLDAIGAIGLARLFTFGGSRNLTVHDPSVQPRINFTKDEYVNPKERTTTINHIYEKLLKLKDLMKTEVFISAPLTFKKSLMFPGVHVHSAIDNCKFLSHRCVSTPILLKMRVSKPKWRYGVHFTNQN